MVVFVQTACWHMFYQIASYNYICINFYKILFMKFISTRLHGLLDYSVAILLLITPWVFGFFNDGPESWTPILLGALTIVYSLLTRYEWGAAKTLSMRTHLLLDALNGLFLTASPWIFGFYRSVHLPHVIIGIMELLVVLTTQTETSAEKRQERLTV